VGLGVNLGRTVCIGRRQHRDVRRIHQPTAPTSCASRPARSRWAGTWTGSGPMPRMQRRQPSPSTQVDVSTVEIGHGGGIDGAVGEGGVWVSTIDGVVRIDPATGEVVAEVAIGEPPFECAFDLSLAPVWYGPPGAARVGPRWSGSIPEPTRSWRAFHLSRPTASRSARMPCGPRPPVRAWWFGSILHRTRWSRPSPSMPGPARVASDAWRSVPEGCGSLARGDVRSKANLEGHKDWHQPSLPAC
jgi:hypothetical protein